jgi:hypothetical protein
VCKRECACAGVRGAVISTRGQLPGSVTVVRAQLEVLQ